MAKKEQKTTIASAVSDFLADGLKQVLGVFPLSLWKKASLVLSLDGNTVISVEADNIAKGVKKSSKKPVAKKKVAKKKTK